MRILTRLAKLLPVLFGYSIYYLVKLLNSTLKVDIDKHPELKNYNQYIFCFWHGRQLLPILVGENNFSPMAALISASRDGEILETVLRKLNYTIVRGSSRNNSVASLLQLARCLKRGLSIGSGIDGPIGPIYEAKLGFLYLSQKFDIPVVPIGSAYKHFWKLKSWDKFEIPKPFSSASICIGRPIRLKGASLQDYKQIIEQHINALDSEAALKLG